MRRSAPRKLIIAGLVAGASLAAAGTAGAAKAPLSFNWAVLSTPIQPNQVVVSPNGPPIGVGANVTPTSATTAVFNVAPADWSFPTYHFSLSGIAGTINVSLKKAASGTIDFGSGAVTMTADLLTDISLGAAGDCTVDSGSQTLSTATAQPLVGQAFPPGAAGALTGNGALAVAWNSLPPGTGSACVLINQGLAGPGGLWVSRGISPNPLVLSVKKLKLTKPGKTAVVHATIKDTGRARTSSIKACLAAPKPLKVKPKCKTITGITGGNSAPVSFKVKTAKKKHHSYKLKLTVKGQEVSSVSKTVTLKVH